MNALRVALPLAAVVFFLWKARRSRVYLLGIPFLLYMRESVFLDNLRVFSMPHRLSQATITLVWLAFVWLLSADLLLPHVKGVRRRVLGPRLLPEETVLVLIAGLILVNTVVTAVERGNLSSALGQAAGMLYLLVGYVLVRAIVSQVPAKEVIDFLWALVVLNTIVACLFILHQGLGLHVYTLGEYHYDIFQGVVITRTFSFMPPLFFLAVAFTFAQRRWDVPTYLVAGINVAAILVSYTRTMLLMVLVAGLTVVVVRLLRRRQAGLAIRRVVTLSVVALVLGIVAFAFLPAQTEYFGKRISRATAHFTTDPSYEARTARLRLVYAQVVEADVLVGKGFASESQDSTVAAMKTWTADGDWIPVLYRLGFAGVVLFALLFFAYCARAFWLALYGSGESEFLGLVFLTFLLTLLIGGLAGWNIMVPDRIALGLWPFAFVAAEAGRSRQELRTASRTRRD